jgi:pimeloyl-ACP methyl ester carboxylesterase
VTPDRTRFVDLNGHRHHIREWGAPGGPLLFLLHGWMDVAQSFQFVVDALEQPWHVVAPDWRGFGRSAWNPGGYWFPDYYADLDALLDHYSPDTPARLVGHSMGGVIACTYAGLCPDRVKTLISLEGFGLARTSPADAPARYARWLTELRQEPRFRHYENFEALAGRLRKDNPRLSADRALFIANAWAHAGATDRIEMLSDPKHKRSNPVLFRIDEMIACWKQVTAPTLWVFARQSEGTGYLQDSAEQLAERKAAFRQYSEAWIEEAGHMMHHDQPAAVAQLIEGFNAGSR